MPPVTLVPMHLELAPRVQELASHPDVVATALLPNPYPPDGAETWIRALEPRREEGLEWAWAVFSLDTLVATVGFQRYRDRQDTVELGYWVGRPYWGQGLATSATIACLELAFDLPWVSTVTARALTRNTASLRVLEKAGFDFLREEANPFPRWSPSDRIAVYELSRLIWSLHRAPVLP